MLIELKRLGAQKLLQILAFLIILTSCMSINDKHGYFPLEKDIDQLIIGKTNKAQVIKIIGPAAISDGASWIYISSNVRSTAFFDPAVTDRNILFLEIVYNVRIHARWCPSASMPADKFTRIATCPKTVKIVP